MESSASSRSLKSLSCERDPFCARTHHLKEAGIPDALAMPRLIRDVPGESSLEWLVGEA